MKNIFLFFSSFIISKVTLPLTLNGMKKCGLTAMNYQDQELPMPASLPLLIFFIIFLALLQMYQVFIVFFLLIILGLIDDYFGDKKIKGLNGHLKAFIKGNITTGFIKATGIFALAFWSTLFFNKEMTSFVILTVNSSLIALSANLINLLDLRPGRAVKVFLFFGFCLVGMNKVKENNWFFVLLGSFLAYLPWDLQEKGMLGDTGANVLGFSLGLSAMLYTELATKIILVFFLFIVHILAENISLSKVINKIDFLRYLDTLGRTD